MSQKSKMKMRKRPELIQLPSVPVFLKISEVPLDSWVAKINLPFFVRHLVKAGIEKAFIIARTGKSPYTLLGSETGVLDELRKQVLSQLIDKYPFLHKHFSVQISAAIHFGGVYGGQNLQPHWEANLPRLQKIFDDCGFSDVPLRFFAVPIQKPSTFVSFVKRPDVSGFVLNDVQGKPATELNLEKLETLIKQNPVLKALKVYICQVIAEKGHRLICRVPTWQKEA